jgi:hypothetical protein
VIFLTQSGVAIMSPDEKTAGNPAKDRIPSSASSGTFMKSPVLENQYYADTSFVRTTNRSPIPPPF